MAIYTFPYSFETFIFIENENDSDYLVIEQQNTIYATNYDIWLTIEQAKELRKIITALLMEHGHE